MPLPNNLDFTLGHRRVLIDTTGRIFGDDVILDSSNTDSGSTPTSRFRAGNVIVKRTSTGRYVEANDGNADVSARAAITSSSHTDATDDIVIVSPKLPGGTLTVTVTTGTGTEAECATDLNANADFAAFFTASSADNELTITMNAPGPENWFYMGSGTHANYGFAEGIDNYSAGTYPDVKVTRAPVRLTDDNGTAKHEIVPTYDSGYFDESQLINLTGEAKQVLVSRGARFG